MVSVDTIFNARELELFFGFWLALNLVRRGLNSGGRLIPKFLLRPYGDNGWAFARSFNFREIQLDYKCKVRALSPMSSALYLIFSLYWES